jgi:hypothetical protein
MISGESLPAKTVAERKSDLALPVGIHVVFLDIRARAVAQKPFYHGRDFRGRTAFELGVDTGGFLLNVPVDHHTWPSVANMPFSEQVLISSSELLGV